MLGKYKEMLCHQTPTTFDCVEDTGESLKTASTKPC